MKIRRSSLIILLAYVGGVCPFGAALPAFPASPDCLFKGNGKISLSGSWQQHPIFRKFVAETKFQFSGIRSNGWTRIRFTTDFGEAALETNDEATSASYWYRGTDEILKSSYENHAFHYGLNPFGYSTLAQKQLSHTSNENIGKNPNEKVFLISKAQIGEGEVSMEYVLEIRNNTVSRFRQVDHYNYPKQDLVLDVDFLTVDWSNDKVALGVPREQTAVFKYGLQNPKPAVDITILTQITNLTSIPANLNLAQAKEDLVSGLFQHQIALPPRRLPDNKPAQVISRTPHKLVIAAGLLLLGCALLIIRRNSRT